MTKAVRKGPQSKAAALRLREALAEMATSGTPGAPTAAALCERAGVSRNALYRYHRDILQDLYTLQQDRCPDPGPAHQELLRLRQEVNTLREQQTKLAALVDHYFAAWQESCSLVQRRDRELANLRRSVRPNVVPFRK